MPRFKLTIEYDGRPFRGWQRQKDRPSVQQALEEAIQRFSGETVVTQTAGRTDAGVHALGQVAHFDLARGWDPVTVREALNFHLKPHPIAIIEAEIVDETFEARFSAISRSYEYRILNRRARPALDEGKVWHVPVPLDVETMHAAAQLILGTHDFSTFRAADCQANSPIRTLDFFSVSRQSDMVVLSARARSFLHSQVRSMVGSLKLVGDGKWQPRDFRAALDAADRSRCGPLAPPDGLYLTAAGY